MGTIDISHNVLENIIDILSSVAVQKKFVFRNDIFSIFAVLIRSLHRIKLWMTSVLYFHVKLNEKI